MKTTIPKVSDHVTTWVRLDADGQVLGRLAVKIANSLRGKDRPTYTPHLDTGDSVVVVNASKVRLSGRKEQNKIYERYSGYRSGLFRWTAAEIRERHPERLIESAVWGMLPHGKLGRQLFRKLKVYAGPDHPHAAQKPESRQG